MPTLDESFPAIVTALAGRYGQPPPVAEGLEPFEALVAVLDPDIVLRADFGPAHPAASTVIRGAAAVARQATIGASTDSTVHPALIDGSAGAVITRRGRPFAIMGFTVADGRIVGIDVIVDAERVHRVAAAVLAGG